MNQELFYGWFIVTASQGSLLLRYNKLNIFRTRVNGWTKHDIRGYHMVLYDIVMIVYRFCFIVQTINQ